MNSPLSRSLTHPHLKIQGGGHKIFFDPTFATPNVGKENYFTDSFEPPRNRFRSTIGPHAVKLFLNGNPKIQEASCVPAGSRTQILSFYFK